MGIAVVFRAAVDPSFPRRHSTPIYHTMVISLYLNLGRETERKGRRPMLDSVGSFRSLWEMVDYLLYHLTSPTITIYNTSPTMCSTYPVQVCQPVQVSFHMLLVYTESVVYDTPLVCVPLAESNSVIDS